MTREEKAYIQEELQGDRRGRMLRNIGLSQIYQDVCTNQRFLI